MITMPIINAASVPKSPASFTQEADIIIQLHPTIVPKPIASMSVLPRTLLNVFLLFLIIITHLTDTALQKI